MNQDEGVKFSKLFVFGLMAGKDGQNVLMFRSGRLWNYGQEIQFSYKSESEPDDPERKAVFFTDKISGYSYSE